MQMKEKLNSELEVPMNENSEIAVTECNTRGGQSLYSIDTLNG